MSAVATSTDVRSMLKLALPIGSRLITGNPNTLISWVSHLRTRPPLFADLEGNELVLVSTSTLANYQKPLTLETIIEELAQTQASALAVRGTLTPRTHQVARQHNFPLISLPDRAVLPQVERAVQRLLTNRPAQLAHRAFELQQTLQRHAASYRGLTTMLTALARMLDRPVVVHDRRGNVVSRGLPPNAGSEWEAHLALTNGPEFIQRVTVRHPLGIDDPICETSAGLTALLIHEHQVYGYLSILVDAEPLDEFDALAMEYSLPMCAREFTRQQTTDISIEPTLPTRDWITEWLSSPASDDPLLALRAEKDSYQASSWYAAVLFRCVPTHERAISAGPERMVRLIQNELNQRRIQAPVGQFMDRAVLLFPLDEPQQTQRLKQMVDLLLHNLRQATPDGEITVGVGRPVQGLTALRESFREAERALTLPEQLGDARNVAFFGDLSLYELLRGVGDHHALKTFSDRWLAPLREYDEQHHTDLLPTLGAYFANNGNMARTAHVLNIHRNTLVYRLSRITEIIQLDMDDSNVRLNLHLALKVERILDKPGANPTF